MALTDEQKGRILELKRQGLGYHLVAKEIGVTRDQVRDFCRTKAAIELANVYGFDIQTQTKQSSKQAKLYTCKYCNGKYYRKNSGINSTTYCSDRCKRESRNKKARETRKKKEAVCRTCGKTFIRKGNDVYCSNECRFEVNVCPVCGKEFRCKRDEQRKVCSMKCKGVQSRATHEEYYAKFASVHMGWIVPITVYEGSDNDLTTYCLKCKCETVRKAGVYIDKRRGCAHCGTRSSTGEEEVKQWLDAKGINYIEQYKHDDVVDKAPLSFDFAITDDNGEVNALIEYNGRQHYEPVKQFGGEKEYQRQVRSDSLKEKFAQANNIKLISIHHKDRNKINKILTNNLTPP